MSEQIKIVALRQKLAGAAAMDFDYAIGEGAGRLYCRVQFLRPVDAAPSMYGVRARATLIDASGAPVIPNTQPVSGDKHAMADKPSQIDPEALVALAARLRDQALRGAIDAMLAEYATKQLNQELGI